MVIVAFVALWEIANILSGRVRDNWDTRRDGSRRYRSRGCEGCHRLLSFARPLGWFAFSLSPELSFVILGLGIRGVVVVCCSLRYLIVTWIGIIVNNPANIRVVSVKVGQNSWHGSRDCSLKGSCINLKSWCLVNGLIVFLWRRDSVSWKENEFVSEYGWT